jgi:hypothetical protein
MSWAATVSTSLSCAQAAQSPSGSKGAIGDLAAAAGRVGQLGDQLEAGAGDIERDDPCRRHPLGGAGDAQAGGALGGDQQQRRGAGDLSHACGAFRAGGLGRLDEAGRAMGAAEQHQRPAPEVGDGPVDRLQDGRIGSVFCGVFGGQSGHRARFSA